MVKNIYVCVCESLCVFLKMQKCARVCESVWLHGEEEEGC